MYSSKPEPFTIGSLYSWISPNIFSFTYPHGITPFLKKKFSYIFFWKYLNFVDFLLKISENETRLISNVSLYCFTVDLLLCLLLMLLCCCKILGSNKCQVGVDDCVQSYNHIKPKWDKLRLACVQVEFKFNFLTHWLKIKDNELWL